MQTKNLFRRAISRFARDFIYTRMDHEAAYDIMGRTAAALNSLGVRWWLMDGTLLGFVREGEFLGHDADVDIGIHMSDYSPALLSALRDTGLQLYSQHGTPDNGLEITVRSRWLYLPGTSLDIFLFYDDEGQDTWWHATSYKGHQMRYRYPRFELETLEVRGQTYNVPSPPERFLVQKYGDDWRTPNTSWHGLLSPKSLQIDHLAPEVQARIRAAQGKQ